MFALSNNVATSHRELLSTCNMANATAELNFLFYSTLFKFK